MLLNPLSTRKHFILWGSISLLCIVVAYYHVIYNEFVNWDDNVYITDNPLVKIFSFQHLLLIFTTTFEGHYHPFTLLSLNFDYQIFGMHAWGFHLHNLLLHLANCILILIFIHRLTGKASIAGMVMALFSVFPMNVEAVAWATARKDVLYAFWFLFSMVLYLQYLKTEKWKYLAFTLITFIFSVLAKGQAVFLPLIFILIDWFKGRKLTQKKVILEKLPFLLLAFIFGLAALYAQKQTGYVSKNGEGTPFLQTLMLACYSFSLYIWKILLPAHLSAYYPYPAMAGAVLPYFYLLFIIPVVFYAYLVRYFLKKNQRLVAFGMLFFVMNIFVFLKWIPVSNYIIADRYVYMAAIGLFIPGGLFLEWLQSRFPKWKDILLSFFLGFLVVGATMISEKRVSTWKNSMSLLNDILERHPDVYPALNSRGDVKLRAGDIDGALADFNKAITVQPAVARAYANRADLYFRTGRMKESLIDFNKAVNLDEKNSRIFNDRGLVRDAMGDLKGAYADFCKAIDLNPSFAEAYNNRGMTLARSGDCTKALEDFDQSIKLTPDLAKAYANRAKCRNKNRDFTAAVEDLNNSYKLGFIHPMLYFELGFSYYNLKDFFKAQEYFSKAITMKPDYPEAWAYRGFSNFNSGSFVSAITDLDMAIKLDETNALAYAMRGLAKVKTNRQEEGCEDFNKAKELGLQQVEKEIEKYCK